ncbi:MULTISPECIES: DUF3846 domain-containing protein [Erysipelotrichaceae]|jgi:hypothetical protein|uniref:DUF3846 domain-containing protein n=1 Tax=Erysipelotrichaceae TaxID=128827 RepID=UPI002492F3B4|nr:MULTISPECIES: DUF3846 domain-containing protein [Erysipelotrichaceae]
MNEYAVYENGCLLRNSAKEINLSVMQNAVRGLIENVSLFFPKLEQMGIDAWANEEGKLNRMDPSALVYQDNELVEVLTGPLLFTRYDEEGRTLPIKNDDFFLIGEALSEQIVLVKEEKPMLVSVLQM